MNPAQIGHQTKLRLILAAGIILSILLIITSFLWVQSIQTSSTDKLLEPVPAEKSDVLIRKDGPPYTPDVLTIRYKQGYAYDELLTNKKTKEIAEIDAILKKAGVVSQEKQFQNVTGALNNYYLLKFPKGTDLVKAQKILHESEYIDFAEPQYQYGLFKTPDDQYYPQMWDLPVIQADKAWDIGTGSSNIIAAVIDTGIQASHPDLPPGTIQGTDYSGTSSSFDDQMGHGTHVAGTIGAVGNNKIGVVGINWNVKLMAIKVCGTRQCGDFSNGVVEAANNGAKVVNMSLGTMAPALQPCSSIPTAQQAINYAVAKGTTIVVAAGNDNRDVAMVSPASCQNVITVGATGTSDIPVSYSNFGAGVSIAAPGGDPVKPCSTQKCITSTIPTSTYGSLQGTSMASPHVAGAAALLLSVNPNLSPQQVKDCLVNNADPIQQTKAIGKRLNVYKALTACKNSAGATQPPTPTNNGTNSPTPTTQNITLTPPAPLEHKIYGTAFEDTNQNGQIDSGDQPLSGVTINLTIPSSGILTTKTGSNGTYEFNKQLFSASGKTFTPGEYTVTAIIPVIQTPIAYGPLTISDKFPSWQVDFYIPKGTSSITPGVTGTPNTPTPSIQIPTLTPTPTRNLTKTPTPTLRQIRFFVSPSPTQGPVVLYECKEDNGQKLKGNQIKIGKLICEPI